MVDGAFPSPEDITLQQFRDAVARYDQLIEAVSASKGGKKNSSAPSATARSRRLMLIIPQPNPARGLSRS